MAKEMNDVEKFADNFLSGLSWDKKSVRTTFKLSQEATQILSDLSEKKGESIKEFFDTLCFNLLFREAIKASDPMLEKLNEPDQRLEFEKINRQVRKTYVVSKTALEKLIRFAKKYEFSRDAFVEYAVRFENESYTQRIDEKKQKHSQALPMVDANWRELENTLKKLQTLLGNDDPVSERFRAACIILMQLQSDIEEELKHGTPISEQY